MVRSRPHVVHIVCGAILVAAATLKIYRRIIRVAQVRDVTLPRHFVAFMTHVEVVLEKCLISSLRRPARRLRRSRCLYWSP
ncbi:MAG: hypothetical protein ACJ8C4_07175 [Gemmataceae bacterium]